MAIHIKHYDDKGFALSDQEIATIAKLHFSGAAQTNTTRGVYLKALVAHAKLELKGKVPDAKALQTAHERLYAIVIKAVNGTESALERNARSAFARSAMSVVRTYVRYGGKLRDLDPREVTKASIREATNLPEILPATRAERVARRLLAMVRKLQPREALSVLHSAISELQAGVDAIGGASVPVSGPEVRSMRGRVRRVSAPPAGAPP